MKKKIILLIFMINYMMLYSNEVYNLGDEIILKINNTNVTEIKSALKDYQVDEIINNEKELKNSYIVKFRSFTLGENKIKISNQEINLKIESNIKEDEKDIYMNYENEGYNKLWIPNFPYVVIGAFLAMIYSCFSLWKISRKPKKLSPHEKYLKGIENLDENQFLFQISLLLREYIDSQFNSNFLNGIYRGNVILKEDDIKFIEILDFAKFSRVSNLKKDEVIDKSNVIYKKIFDYKKEELEKIKRGDSNV